MRSEPHTIIVRVYFPDLCRTHDVRSNAATRPWLRQCYHDGANDTYIAGFRSAHDNLTPHIIPAPLS